VPVHILGIESSCDETAAALVNDAGQILSSVVASQLASHARYGGVVPEIASREHLRAIGPVVRTALAEAGLSWPDIDAIAVTAGPGLIGSLLVGVTYSKALSYARQIPLVAINHVEGHIHAVILEAKQAGNPVRFPALALVVSGGHTHLFSVGQEFNLQLIGKTRDDAAGEAFDKVSKLFGFGYPGGPVIDRLAGFGNPRAIRFPIAKMKGNGLDFSFSGLKTAVLRWFESQNLEAEAQRRREFVSQNPHPSLEEWLAITPQPTLDALASFQRTVIAELLMRVQPSAAKIGAESLIIAGGVACNQGLRSAAAELNLGFPIHFPSVALSTDNAVMIAAAAFPKYDRGEFAGLDTPVYAQLPLAGSSSPG